jgi:dynamin 1-like protein
MAGDNKGICNDSINLKIFSPNVVNLTLVDLPGITKVAVGDQPEDIEDQIKSLIFNFIKNPRSIILAVSAANADLATSEALKFAKEVDAEGSRTLAVLTKLDLMDKGTNAMEVLSGRVIPVKLGIIGVVNRSQQAINENKKIEAQLKYESQFFEANYPDLAEVNGTGFLEETLSEILVTHIKKCLPDLVKRVQKKTLLYQEKLKALGKEVIDEKSTMIHAVTQFANNYILTIDGSMIADNPSASKLFEIIHEELEQDLKAVEFNAKFPKEILSSVQPSLFSIPSFNEPFDKIVTDKVRLLRDPSMNCAQKIMAELQRLIKNCGQEVQQELQRFPKLYEKIVETTNDLICDRMKVVQEKIDDIINSQIAYTNKKHPNFDRTGALKLIGRPQIPELGQELTFEEKKIVLEGLFENYMEVERIIVHDSVAKAIVCFFVNYMKKNILPQLITITYNAESITDLMQEPKKIVAQRNKVRMMLEVKRRIKI